MPPAQPNYRNDYAFGIERQSIIPTESGLAVNKAEQRHQTEFAAMWMGNLVGQGFVANAARQPLIKTLKQLEEEG